MPQSNELRNQRREAWKNANLCAMCGKQPPVAGGTNCDNCRGYYRNYRKRNEAKGGCTKCGRPPVSGGKQCEQCLAQAKRYREQLRDEVFTAYGGYVCACCGEMERVFLQIDHIANDGAAHRREITGHARQRNIYHWFKKNGFPPGFQVLCANCNWAKGQLGYCPHQQVDREVASGKNESPATI